MRDKQIDLLRFLGLSLIILAHVHPPRWLFQLRNFDVPLLVLVSGMALKYTDLQESYAGYVWKRIKRLVFPTWIFLTIYFLLMRVTGIGAEQLTSGKILESYLLMKGIGFVWVIRVFLLAALAAPFVLASSKKIKSNQQYLGTLLIVYLAYELVLHLTAPFTTGFVEAILYYGIAYGIVFALGVRLRELTPKEVSAVGVFSLISFAILGCFYYFAEGRIVSTQGFKYPPSAYYLSYAIAASVLLWSITKDVDKYWNRLGKAKGVIMFIAQNSLWIYLWHIPVLKISSEVSTGTFLGKYILVYCGAALITFVQITLVQKWLLPSIKNETARKNIKIVLTG